MSRKENKRKRMIEAARTNGKKPGEVKHKNRRKRWPLML